MLVEYHMHSKYAAVLCWHRHETTNSINSSGPDSFSFCQFLQGTDTMINTVLYYLANLLNTATEEDKHNQIPQMSLYLHRRTCQNSNIYILLQALKQPSRRWGQANFPHCRRLELCTYLNILQIKDNHCYAISRTFAKQAPENSRVLFLNCCFYYWLWCAPLCRFVSVVTKQHRLHN